MKLYSLIAWMLFVAGSLHAEIFKWTDNAGIVHFSDSPHEGAETVNIPQTQSNSKIPTAPSATGTAGSGDEKADYHFTVTIKDPQNNATIRNNRGYVPVMVSVDPELMPGDLLQIIYDGKVLGKPQKTPLFALNDVNRGTHTIEVQLVDKDEKVLSISESVTFFMHRPQVGMVHQAQ